MVILTILLLFTLLEVLLRFFPIRLLWQLNHSLFPLGLNNRALFLIMFLFVGGFNLVSLVSYRFPVTTTLGFNLFFARSLWFSSILLFLLRRISFQKVLPSNSPWYLVPFLRLVEAVRMIVRPITLCFRLLANISAGHILLTLISKISLGIWILGIIFGLLELIVSVVQAFVFMILVRVYLDEVMSSH